MTQEELQEQIENAVVGFSALEGVTDELAERLVGEGFLSYDDLSVIEPDDLMEMGEISQEVVDRIVEQAEAKAEEAEQAAAAERRRQKEQERIDKATTEAETLEAAKEASAPAETAPEGVELGDSPDTLEHSTTSDDAKVEQAEAAPDATDASDEASPPPSVSSDESSSSKEEVAE